MLFIQLVTAVLVVSTNVALTTWALLKHNSTSGIGTFFLGSCSTVKRLDSAIHLVLNVVSSLFLGAGNYCMQILAAPAVKEVHASHSRGKALEIGIPSLKNLFSIDLRRGLLSILPALVSTVLHLLSVTSPIIKELAKQS